MFPLILLGAGLAGFLVGKQQKSQEIGRAKPRELAKEKQRRIVSLAAYHQAKRKDLSDVVSVATAKAVYQAKGGRDVAFIARLDSMDPEFIGIGGPGQTRRIERRKERLERRQPSKPKVVVRGPKGPVKPRQRPIASSQNSRRFQDESFQDESFQDEQEQQEQEQQEPIIVINQPAPQPAPKKPAEQAPEADEADEAPEDFDASPEETAAALAFTRAKDAGDDNTKAREKAKSVYEAMGGKEGRFLDMISGWSED